MSFLARSLLAVARQPCIYSSLTSSMRGLSITPPRLLQKPEVITPVIPTAVAPEEEQRQCQDVFNKVNSQLSRGEEGRLFAVVHLCGKQFKVTTGDIILVEGYWPPTIGDEIRLEKVLLAGARDFTLIGRPLLEPGLVNIKATIIEKTLTHTKTHFKKKRRKQYMRINFQRSPNTMIRINSIEVGGRVDAPTSTVEDKRLF